MASQKELNGTITRAIVDLYATVVSMQSLLTAIVYNNTHDWTKEDSKKLGDALDLAFSKIDDSSKSINAMLDQMTSSLED